MATVFQASEPQQRPQPNVAASFVKDLISVVSLGIILECVHDHATPFMRGFQCDDETIRYPYKDSTITSGACYFIGSGVNIALILILEYVNLIAGGNLTDGCSTSGDFQHKIYLRNVYCRFIVWLFGAICSELMTDVTKVTAGRLRPHFISVCKPVIGSSRLNLDDYCRETKSPYDYITDYNCSGDDGKQRDARLSFLSGHSSYSAYSATFAVLYIHSAVDIVKLGLLKPALQVLITSMALYTGLSRVSDYKHHWQDVLAGLVLGTSVATLISVFLWPPVYRTYARLIKDTSQQTRSVQSGEELNRFSY